MILSAVFLIGFSTLAFEVLLTRIFSIGQWNHLSFMVIGIALFGFAASGTFLSIFNARNNRQRHSLATLRAPAILLVLYAGSTVLAFIVLNRMPLDYFRLPVEPRQSLYLLIAFLILALPFFFSGSMVAVAYMRLPEKAGLIYFATMCGSACGALAPVLLLPFLREGILVILFAVIPLILMPTILKRLRKERQTPSNQGSFQVISASISVVLICLATFLVTPPGEKIIRVKPSPYKTLSQVLQFPKTRIVQTRNSIRGRIDRITSPYIRFAPGLSLQYMQSIESQDATYKDGDNQLVLYHLSESQLNTRFSEFTLAYSGYQMLTGVQKALVLLQGGGTAIASALTAGIPNITIVVENPALAEMIHKHYGLKVISQAPRAFVSQTPDRYDIIHVENWGSSIPGSAALNLDPLYTIDAFRKYLHHLTPGGMIIISRRLLLPPADCLRLWASAYEGLMAFGSSNPEAHLAILRNWDTFTLLVSRQPLKNADRLEAFAENRNFDFVFLPGMNPNQANRYNQFDAPYYFAEINRLASAYRNGKEKSYFRSYLLDIRPQTDNRPFPDRFLKWRKLKELYRTLGSRVYALLLSGEIVVAVVFIEALVVSGLLLFLPLFFIRRRDTRPSWAQVIFFLGVGAGFMFIELFFIKKFNILFGDPVISFTVVVAGILIFSSFGGAWTHNKTRSVLKPALIILMVLMLMIILAINPLIGYLLRYPEIWRYSAALIILLPIGFLMGMPFPVAMGAILESATQRAYAWSVNGCASVLTSIVSAQIALAFGISSIMGCALVSYIVVAFTWYLIDRSA